MTTQAQDFMRQIDQLNDRGVGQFHVFCDEPFYIAGEHVGKHHYHSSWGSLEVARLVAKKNDNGIVYNSSGKDVTNI